MIHPLGVMPVGLPRAGLTILPQAVAVTGAVLLLRAARDGGG